MMSTFQRAGGRKVKAVNPLNSMFQKPVNNICSNLYILLSYKGVWELQIFKNSVTLLPITIWQSAFKEKQRKEGC